MFVFQTPYNFEQLTGQEDEDNFRYDPTPANQSGGYHLNGGWFTKLNNDAQGIEAALDDKYKNFFKFQRKEYDHVTFDQALQKIVFNHESVKVIYQTRLTYVNRKNVQRRFRFNKLLPSRTTWKYPYMIHDGTVEKSASSVPDRKMFVMFVATPIFGGIEDTGEPMHGIDMDDTIEADDVQVKHVRFGSHIDDRFAPGEAEGEGDADGSQGPTTRSQSKAKVEAQPPEAAPVTYKKKIETNEYGWAYDQSIMIRPTFELWWKNMPLKRVGYR
jgi:hypothetical protein